jgi:hypothetical protein
MCTADFWAKGVCTQNVMYNYIGKQHAQEEQRDEKTMNRSGWDTNVSSYHRYEGNRVELATCDDGPAASVAPVRSDGTSSGLISEKSKPPSPSKASFRS